MEQISHKNLKVNGINIHVAEIGKGPEAVLFLHGFPELWYSWRHQMLHLSARGYRAIAPDLRGFGDPDAPPSAASYTVFHVVGDLVALLDELGLEQVFLEPGKAEETFASAETTTVIKMFLSSRDPNPPSLPEEMSTMFKDRVLAMPSWLTEEDVNYYASKFNKTGFTGGLNYYRAMDLSWELSAAWTGSKIKVPVKFIIGDLDLTYHFPGVKDYIDNGGFKKYVPLLDQVVVMEGVAHFLNQEKPEEVSQHIYDFINKF